MDYKGYCRSKVISNTEIAANIYRLRVENNTQQKAEAGQFYMLRVQADYPLLARPLSICDFTQEYIEFLYAKVGKGTKLLSAKSTGAGVDLLGPLGKGFDCLQAGKRVAVIAGGIGIAPFKFLLKQLQAAKVDIYLGFRDTLFGCEDLAAYGEIYIATEDGSIGSKGYVTQLLQGKDYDTAFVCGPLPMMQAVSKLQVAKQVYLSLEAHMGCGIGACLGCQVNIKDKGNLRICHEGPVFLADEVNFDA